MARTKKFDYFDAFEQLAELAVRESQILIDVVENYSQGTSFRALTDSAHEIEHQGDIINHDIFHAVAADFVTPIEREDIISLAQGLDTIIDLIEDCMLRFYMYDVHEMHSEALNFAYLIRDSCTALARAMEDFRNFKKSKNFKNLIISVNTYEEEGDKLYFNMIRNLYTVERDRPVHVLVWTKVFEQMEACCDACEHAADQMETILLKNV